MPEILTLTEDGPHVLTFWTDVLVEDIVEVAELPVKNEAWRPGEKWATIEGSLIFRRNSQTKIRTSYEREKVRELMRSSADGWITVPFTIRDPQIV